MSASTPREQDNILFTDLAPNADDSLLQDDELAPNSDSSNLKSQHNKPPSIKKKIPQMLCLTVFALIVLTCLFNIQKVKIIYHTFIEWIRLNPYLAVGAIILFYIISVCLNMPIVQTHVMLGYTYSQVFSSYLKGYMFILPVVFVGCMLGSLAAMLLSRYLFRDMVKERIEKNRWLSKKFNAIDSILIEKGA